MENNSIIEIHYDDLADDVIRKVNAALESHGLQFYSDGEVHDGFDLYELVKEEK